MKYKHRTLKERVEAFMQVQQVAADQLGLANAVPHRAEMVLYDIWNKRIVNVSLIKGTEVKKSSGNTEPEIFYFDRSEEQGERKTK